MSEDLKPPGWVKNEKHWRKQYGRMIARAYDLIHERIDIIDAARELLKYRNSLRLKDNKFIIFDAILSETAHLPHGPSRSMWDEEVLKSKDIELEDVRSHFRVQALDAAQRIVAEYERIARSQFPD